MDIVYKASKWIAPDVFFYSRALNRKLNPELHAHDFFEIVYLISGCVRQTINNIEYDMLPGEIVILRPGDQHQLKNSSKKFDMITMAIVSSEMELYLNAYHINDTLCKPKEPHYYSVGPTQYSLEALFGRLNRISKAERQEQLRIILGVILHEFIYSQSRYCQNWLDGVFQQMNSHQNLVEGVPAMQRLCNLSRSQLCRVVKKYTDMTPQQYLKELRLAHAYNLIQSTDLPYEDISYNVGYSSFSHFSVSFKQRFGITPSLLRKQKTGLL